VIEKLSQVWTLNDVLTTIEDCGIIMTVLEPSDEESSPCDQQ